ncbi:MAG: DUF5798 family protein [Halodesulfurarchaeum sp.]
MGLGGTAKKLQKVVDVADELYARINDLREEMATIRDRIDSTNEQVDQLEGELAEQRVLLERIAEANGVNVSMEPEENAEKRIEDTTGETTEE